MTLSTFPTFLTFLTERLCFAAPTRHAWEGVEIPAYLRHKRRGPPTGPVSQDLTGQPQSASDVAMAPRRRLPDRRRHASR
jgi:hypothetical protein